MSINRGSKRGGTALVAGAYNMISAVITHCHILK